MSESFVAEIRIFPYNFAPRNWAFCNGQLLPISQNTALFSLLGTNYGGDGRSTFALPNLQGNFALGQGQGPGLTDRFQGEVGGSASVTLLTSEVPGHTHQLMATASPTSASPAGTAMSATATGAAVYKPGAGQAVMAADSVAPVGGSPHENRQPYLGLHFCISLFGIFPPRS